MSSRYYDLPLKGRGKRRPYRPLRKVRVPPSQYGGAVTGAYGAPVASRPPLAYPLPLYLLGNTGSMREGLAIV
jgi:hypothetical protein